MVRAVIVGAAGRMGRALVRAAHETGSVQVIGAIDAVQSGQLGRDAGAVAGLQPIGVAVAADLDAALALQPAVVIDFSYADAVPETIDHCAAAGVALLIGTTGLSEAIAARFDAVSRKIPLLVAANTSLGVALLIELVRAAAARLPSDYDVEIFEAHHRDKQDAPSGTAIALGRAAAAARGRRLEDSVAWARQGPGPRRPGEIGFAVSRGGDLVGEHRVVFAGTGEQVVLEHRATDRAVFARGALAAAVWLARQPSGRYAMRDVLGLQSVG
jgi:4-hydroxy-tetrahydrodipicolinate reductase